MVDGTPGIYISGNAWISGARGILCDVAVFFTDAQSEERITTYDANYAGDDNALCTGQSFILDTNSDLLVPIFLHVPNSAFAVYKSENDLICYLLVGRSDTNEFLKGGRYHFKMKYINGQKTTEDY